MYRGGGGYQGVLQRVKSFQMDSGRVSMSQKWSRVTSAEVKEEYSMTLQGRLKVYSVPHISKVEGHFKFI